ncbi:MAG TPA: UbiA family prenyltransferase [Candidatus Bathyarchaeia archaeon]|nr:UbiA family prenyltransferase [Candidatus Bathyarchaeia archaeon]
MTSTNFSASLRANLNDYVGLMKPAIAILNVFVGVATMLLAVNLGSRFAIPLLLIILAGYLSAAGAGALNCFLERRLDAQMNRTRERPLPSGRISANSALLFGLVFSISGVVLAVILLNTLTALFIGVGLFGMSQFTRYG